VIVILTGPEEVQRMAKRESDTLIINHSPMTDFSSVHPRLYHKQGFLDQTFRLLIERSRLSVPTTIWKQDAQEGRNEGGLLSGAKELQKMLSDSLSDEIEACCEVPSEPDVPGMMQFAHLQRA
jgi:hypothetical protein